MGTVILIFPGAVGKGGLSRQKASEFFLLLLLLFCLNV